MRQIGELDEQLLRILCLEMQEARSGFMWKMAGLFEVGRSRLLSKLGPPVNQLPALTRQLGEEEYQ